MALNVSAEVIEAEWGNETRTQWNTLREVYVDANMAVSMLSQNDSESEAVPADSPPSLSAFAVEIVLPALLLCCCAVAFGWHMKRKSGLKGTASFEAAETNM